MSAPTLSAEQQADSQIAQYFTVTQSLARIASTLEELLDAVHVSTGCLLQLSDNIGTDNDSKGGA